MRYCLINCYSDLNKGDLGIILSTIERIKLYDDNATINAVSTYAEHDPRFTNDHTILKTKVERVFPALNGILYLKIGKKILNHPILKVFGLVLAFRFLIYLIYPKSTILQFICLSKNERKTIKTLLSSDKIISKGGSFLCCENNLRSKVAFLRQGYIFHVIKRLKKKYYILGQSIGPAYGNLVLKELNWILRNSSNTYFREVQCLEKYPYIKYNPSPDEIITDMAFTLSPSTTNVSEAIISSDNKMKVGLTLKFIKDEFDKDYSTQIKNSIAYLIEKHDAYIYIFPHVQVNEDELGQGSDIKKAKDIYFSLSDKYKSKVTIFYDYYNPFELKELYSKMDIFIGTRLHSAIFAITENVPVINISYHGTKSKGVMGTLNLEEWVIDETNFDLLNNKIDQLIQNADKVKANLTEAVRKSQNLIDNAIKLIISDSI